VSISSKEEGSRQEGRTVTDIAIEEVLLLNDDIQLRVDCTLEAPERKKRRKGNKK
jgi:hypothetical protein